MSPRTAGCVVALAVVACAMCVSASTPDGFTLSADVFNEEEDVMTQLLVAVDSTQGADDAMSRVETSAVGGYYDVTLTRNDLKMLYIYMPNGTASARCFGFKLPSPRPVPVLPTNSSYAKFNFVGYSLIDGRMLEHHRLYVDGFKLGVYLDPATGHIMMINNKIGMGEIFTVRSINESQPSSSLFDVPKECQADSLILVDDLAPLPRPPATASLLTNLGVIARHSSDATYSLAPNQYLGSSLLEFASRRLMKPMRDSDLLAHFGPSLPGPLYKPLAASRLPGSIDRHAEGYTTPVRDQASCGGCWAFSTAASIEVNTAVAGGSRVALAPQNLLDCAPPGSGIIAAKGCNGGWPLTAMAYANATGGLATEESYPFAEVDGVCKAARHVSPLTGFAAIERGNVLDMMAAIVEHGSIVTIMQVLEDFIFFRDGVYANPACTGAVLSHAIALVGYGVDPVGGPYWLVKNSFGGNWGDGGYFKMQRGTNMCGVENWGAVPIVAAPSRS